MNNNKKECLVLVPAFNESKSILEVAKKLKKINEVDFLVVDDFSYDDTDILCEKNKVPYIRNNKNLGLSKTMRTGMAYALENGYSYCIQFDGDNQHDASSILPLIEEVKKGYNIVLTSRFKKGADKPILKGIVWKIFMFLFKRKTKLNITDPTCGMRIFDKKFMKSYVDFPKFEVEPSTIMYCVSKMKFKISEIPTIVYERKVGESLFKTPSAIIKYVLKQLRRMTFTTLFWKYHKEYESKNKKNKNKNKKVNAKTDNSKKNLKSEKAKNNTKENTIRVSDSQDKQIIPLDKNKNNENKSKVIASKKGVKKNNLDLKGDKNKNKENKRQSKTIEKTVNSKSIKKTNKKNSSKK